MRPVLLEVGAAFAIEEAAGPRELFTRRRRPNRGRQRLAERVLEFGAFHRAQPWAVHVRDTYDIRTRRGFPPIEILIAFFDLWAIETYNAEDPTEFDLDSGHALWTPIVYTRLISS